MNFKDSYMYINIEVSAGMLPCNVCLCYCANF